MPLDPPAFDTGTHEEWFLYFRVTKFLPGMPEKFSEQIAFAPDAAAAHKLMTAYAAACLDVIVFTGLGQFDIVTGLEMMFEMPAASLLHLNAPQMAQLMSYDDDFVIDTLRRNGYAIDGKGDITGFTPPERRRPAALHRPKL